MRLASARSGPASDAESQRNADMAVARTIAASRSCVRTARIVLHAREVRREERPREETPAYSSDRLRG
jgi:hypothetical protein